MVVVRPACLPCPFPSSLRLCRKSFEPNQSVILLCSAFGAAIFFQLSLFFRLVHSSRAFRERTHGVDSEKQKRKRRAEKLHRTQNRVVIRSCFITLPPRISRFFAPLTLTSSRHRTLTLTPTSTLTPTLNAPSAISVLLFPLVNSLPLYTLSSPRLSRVSQLPLRFFIKFSSTLLF